MNYDIEKLKIKFDEISNLGWIKSEGKGGGAAGITFEKKLGLFDNNFEIPDYDGIEIKTKRIDSNAYITLFNATFDGPFLFEIKRIHELYGWPDSSFKDFKVFNTSVFANIKSAVGLWWKMRLIIDYFDKKIYLEVFDLNGNLIERKSYWSFELLQEKLLRKFQYLAFIDVDRKYIRGVEYFFYQNITFYKLRSFDAFIKALDRGFIRVSFRVGIYKKGYKFGKIYDHGTAFGIKREDLNKLFIKI